MSLLGRTSQTQTMPSPIEAVEKLNEIGYTLLYDDPESAQKRFEHALHLARKIDHKSGAAKAHSGLAVVYQSLGMDDKATEHAQSAEDLCFVLEKPQHVGQIFLNLGDMYRQRLQIEAAASAYQQALTRFELGHDRFGMMQTYNAVGLLHAQTGAQASSLESYLQAAQIANAAQAYPQLASIYVSIAKLYYEQELLQLATDYAQKAVELGRSLESNRRLLAQIHNLLGVLAKSQGNRDRAFAHYGEALKLRQLIEDEQGLADTNHNIGILYEENNELKDALHYYSQALALRRELKDQQGLVRSFVVLGTAHRKLQQHDLASNYLHRALELAQQLRHYNLESNIQYELAELDAERGDYEQAFFHQRRHTELRRFLFSETRSAQIAHAQTKFEAFRELQQDEVTRLCSEEIEQRIEERIRPIIRSMETSQDEANEAKHTLSETKEISMLKTQLMRAVSHELRTPLAVVANASYILERFNKRLEASKREANFARIKESIVYMKELLDEIAWVDASVLTHLSVAPELIGIPALRERIVSGLSISLLDRGRLLVTTPDVDDVVKLDVGMVQQAVNQLISNAMKFSREPSGDDPMVELDINYLAGEMVITVSDYGVGIPFEDQAGIGIPFARANNVNGVRGLGLGLSIVKKLVEAMDGRFAIESKGAGKGCQTMVALPCSELNSAEARHLQINPRVIA